MRSRNPTNAGLHDRIAPIRASEPGRSATLRAGGRDLAREAMPHSAWRIRGRPRSTRVCGHDGRRRAGFGRRRDGQVQIIRTNCCLNPSRLLFCKRAFEGIWRWSTSDAYSSSFDPRETGVQFFAARSRGSRRLLAIGTTNGRRAGPRQGGRPEWPSRDAETQAKAAGSGSAWSAAAKGPLSAPFTGSPRASTIITSLSPARLSSTPDKARRSGAALGLAADRIYDDYESMAKAEAARRRNRGGRDRHAE